MKWDFQILLLILSISTGFISCRKEVGYVCGAAGSEYIESFSVPSRVINFERKAKLDSSFTSVSGIVLSKDSTKAGSKNDKILFGSILAIEKKSNQKYTGQTTIEGKFSMVLPPSAYDFQFEFVGYNPLIIKNVFVNPSERIEIKALLGSASYLQGPVNNIFNVVENDRIVEDKTLKSKQKKR